MPEEERITVASLYLDGATLSWYQWMFNNGFITSWEEFLQALESRFAPTFYDDPKGALFKLTQKGTINKYLMEFERLANRVVGLPPPFLLSCFISGLCPDIRDEVMALQPISLLQATALAKLQEEKLRDRVMSNPRNLYQPKRPPPLTPSPTKKAKPPYVQRTPTEIAFQREKGLCYNCDEKWNTNHRCKGQVMLLIADEQSPNTDVSISKLEETHPTAIDNNIEPSVDSNCSHISLHAFRFSINRHF